MLESIDKNSKSVSRMATNHLDGSRANFGNGVSKVPQTMDSAELKICMVNQVLSLIFEKNEFCLYRSVSGHLDIKGYTGTHTSLMNVTDSNIKTCLCNSYPFI
jgi:hypothetical protein